VVQLEAWDQRTGVITTAKNNQAPFLPPMSCPFLNVCLICPCVQLEAWDQRTGVITPAKETTAALLWEPAACCCRWFCQLFAPMLTGLHVALFAVNVM
jgi:hypothetical protein